MLCVGKTSSHRMDASLIVGIAAPYPLIRTGIKTLLKNDRCDTLVYESATIKALSDDKPVSKAYDIVLIDTRVTDFKRNNRLIERLASKSKAILLTPNVDRQIYNTASKRKITGLISLTSACDEISGAIDDIAQGRKSWASLQHAAPGPLKDETPLIMDLTSAESRVVRQVAKGLLNKQIAYELGITENTVKAHLINIKRKTKVRSRTELAMRWLSSDQIARQYHSET